MTNNNFDFTQTKITTGLYQIDAGERRFVAEQTERDHWVLYSLTLFGFEKIGASLTLKRCIRNAGISVGLVQPFK
jgi:hypothetical protein